MCWKIASMNDSSHRTTTIHPAVRVGHVHLKVSDLERSLRFYRDALGFAVTADGRPAGPPAVFLAAGDYHSHIALNTFESEGATPPPPGHTGLYHVALLYPDRHELARAVRRLEAHNVGIDHASDHGATVSVYLDVQTATGSSCTTTGRARCGVSKAVSPSSAPIRSRSRRSPPPDHERTPRAWAQESLRPRPATSRAQTDSAIWAGASKN
jgi:catechol 2,3-dioxygenase